jgi:hypothetical protein
MSKERYNQIINDAYKNFVIIYYKETFKYEPGSHNRLMSLDEFMVNIKSSDEFSEKWGLKIEDKELSLEERARWLQDNTEWELLVGNLDHDHVLEVVEEEAPTKLITITYNNETIESYE